MSPNQRNYSATGPDHLLEAKTNRSTLKPLRLEDFERMNATSRLEGRISRLCDGIEEGVSDWATAVFDLKILSEKENESEKVTLTDEWQNAIEVMLPDTERANYRAARSNLSPLLDQVIDRTTAVSPPPKSDAYQLGDQLERLLGETVIPQSDLKTNAKLFSLNTLATLAQRRMPKILSSTGDTQRIIDYLKGNRFFARLNNVGLQMQAIHGRMRKASDLVKDTLISINAFPDSIPEDDLKPFLVNISGDRGGIGPKLIAHAKKILKEKSGLDIPSRRLGSSDLLWMPSHFSISQNRLREGSRLPQVFNSFKEVDTKENCKTKVWSFMLGENGEILYHFHDWERVVKSKIDAMRKH